MHAKVAKSTQIYYFQSLPDGLVGLLVRWAGGNLPVLPHPGHLHFLPHPRGLSCIHPPLRSTPAHGVSHMQDQTGTMVITVCWTESSFRCYSCMAALDLPFSSCQVGTDIWGHLLPPHFQRVRNVAASPTFCRKRSMFLLCVNLESCPSE